MSVWIFRSLRYCSEFSVCYQRTQNDAMESDEVELSQVQDGIILDVVDAVYGMCLVSNLVTSQHLNLQ